MNQIVFSEAARRDRQEITAYTVEHFGVHQARRLRDAEERKRLSRFGRFQCQRRSQQTPGHRDRDQLGFGRRTTFEC